MTNIIYLVRQQQMKHQEPPRRKPTERAQIVIHYTCPHPTPIFRFNNVKKAQREYDKLLKVWTAWHAWGLSGGATTKKEPSRLVAIDADLFIGTIDVASIATAMFVNLAEREKFVAWE